MIRFDFSGKIILITGGASGMGAKEAELLAHAGADVWVTDINEDALTEFEKELADDGLSVHSAKLDVTSTVDWFSLVSRITREVGRLDGVINNAGISMRKSLEDTTPDDWSMIMRVNMDSVFFGMKYCLPLLKNSPAASVVNVSSIAGLMGYFAPGYGTSKWAVRGLSQAAALEFASAGIRVNSIHPGLVNSKLLNSGTNNFVEESLKAVPIGRVAEPMEIAKVAAFLLDESSSYMTGAEVVVDGGLTSGGNYQQIISRLQHDEKLK